MDEVLFDLAWLLTEVKHEDSARVYFRRLIRDYPTSKYIPDAYLSFGDYYFEKKQFVDAIRFYDKVAQFPKSRVFATRATSRAGAGSTWTTTSRRWQRSSPSSTWRGRVRARATRRTGSPWRRRPRRTRCALRPGGRAEKAWPLFQRIGGDQAPTLLEQLGEIYGSQGKAAAAITVYHQLMAIAPASPRCVPGNTRWCGTSSRRPVRRPNPPR